MSGAIGPVPVVGGQAVQAGDMLFSMEAMKMETSSTADRAGTIDRVLVRPGDRVQAKDLLMVWH